MSGPSAKRQRANTEDTPVPLALDYKEIIKTFDIETLRDLLLSAAATSQHVASEIVYRHGDILRVESTRVVDFDHYSKSVWHELAGGGRLRGAQAHDLALDVGWSIDRTIETICKDAGAHRSFGPKKNALITLRKIGKVSR